MFTPEEISIMQSAVETYNEENRMILNYDLQIALAQSCLAKMEHYSPLTYFTKQEYTLIAMSIELVIAGIEALPHRQRDMKLYKSLLSLFDRICTLAR